MKTPRVRLPEILAVSTLLLWIQSYIVPGDIGPIGCVNLRSQHGWLSLEIGFGHGGMSLPVPYWVLFAPLAIWVGVRFRRRAGHRSEGGRCPTCGYDLRATPDRCPECGKVPGT